MDTPRQEPYRKASSMTGTRQPLHVVHIALQGCIKAGEISYGITADTGGHIRYLLEQVQALRDVGITQSVVTRAFVDDTLGSDYQRPCEQLMPAVMLYRLKGGISAYLPKEDLYRDLDALGEALAAWLAHLPRLPDLLHAHYADAGVLAMGVRERLGIPFVFTAHSLGAVKANCLQPAAAAGDDVVRSLDRRIAAEQRVIDRADMIVASSDDEAQCQYGLYRAAPLGRSIRVNPPGCNLALLGKPVSRARVVAMLDRFLADPHKPILLCLARPVRKKNLLGVIDAYAQDAALRARANLVIFAGTRGNLADQEPECKDVLRGILERIEQHDLYGCVAFPKHHLAEDVPAIYQHAAATGGVFVNAAFNEPFGLTFIEAAAAGLPTVASRNGGGKDILARCRNGLLVDPHDRDDIVRAAHRLLDDRALWQRCADAGRAGVVHYSWHRHARQYLRECTQLIGDPAVRSQSCVVVPLSRRNRRATGWLLVTDMDDTLLGDADALAEFDRWLSHHPEVRYVVATGRNAADARAELARWQAPLPEILISGTGSEIHQLANDHRRRRPIRSIADAVLDEHWSAILAARWQREACVRVLARCTQITPQPGSEQGRNKLSYFTRAGPAIVELLQEQLAEAGLAAEVVYSHGRFVDVLPPGGAKGGAAEYLRQRLHLPVARLIGAGNSGNDIDLLSRSASGIAVANCDADLHSLACRPHVFFASTPFAAGLVEGLEHWLGQAKPDFRTA